jgi:outer membrane phospholipase A
MTRRLAVLLVGFMAGSPAFAAEGDPVAPPVPPAAPVVRPDRPSPFSAYRENYLIYGVDSSPLIHNQSIKFQFSVKYETELDHLYFGYRQRSIWNIASDSAPFSDHNFEPEFFYQWPVAAPVRDRWSLSAFQIGVVHESNGRDGVDSRGWNRVYVEPRFQWGEWYFQPKVWAIISKADENTDIEDYYGVADYVFGFERPHWLRAALTARAGERKGGVRGDLFFRLHSKQHAHFYLQAWHGYGETLLGYNLKSNALRIGFEFHL